MTLYTELSECPEKRLLVLCARTEGSPEVESQIRDLLERRLDWEYLLEEATEHSITPLLDRQLRAIAPGAVPEKAREKLKGACRANAVRCLFLSAELAKVLEAFRGAELVAIPYKGPVLAVQAYGDVTLRDFDDLDIILRQEDMPKADELMRAMGYRPRFDCILSSRASAWMVPGEYKYIDAGRRAIVELHTELTLRHFPRAPRLEDLAKQLVSVPCGGVQIPTFSPDDGLPILCVHGAKDFWERIVWVADIAELVRAHPALDWDRSFKVSAAFGSDRMLNLGLALAAELLDTELSAEVAKRVKRDTEAMATTTELARRLLNREEPPLDATSRFHFRRRMVPGWLHGWRYAMRLSMVPAEDDLEMVRLPRALAPVYAVLRPLRLVRKYRPAPREEAARPPA
jgi:Uncharacterised nucleotidyltransferase